MPLHTEEYDLAAEADRLTDIMERMAEQQAEYPYDSDAASQVADEGQRAERLRSGVRWALSEWDTDAVTLGALTNGERHRVRDVVNDTGWKSSDVFVAAGTIDAPYLEHDPNAITDEEFRETALAVVDLHPAFVDYLEDRIGSLSHMSDDEGKSYRELVREKRTSES